YSVYHCSFEHDICLDFSSPKRSRRISREEWAYCPAAEYNYPALFKMPYRPVSDIRLGNLLHSNSCLYSYLGSQRLQRIGNRQGVHRGREHSYMISSGSVHSAARSASPEVASANNDPYLNTGVIALFDT